MATSGLLWGASDSCSRLAWIPQIIPVSYLTTTWGGLAPLDFRGTYMGAHSALTGWELADAHSMDLWMERRNKLWVKQQAHSGPQSIGLWLQDHFVSHQKYKGVSCLWGMDTNRRNESTLPNLKKCTRFRAQNPRKPALLMGIILLLIISRSTKTPQNKAIFFFTNWFVSSLGYRLFLSKGLLLQNVVVREAW